MITPVGHLPWMADALCAQVGSEPFFPDKGGSAVDGRVICDDCPVQSECLAYALANGERWGIWGGKTETQRRKIQRDMKGTAA